MDNEYKQEKIKGIKSLFIMTAITALTVGGLYKCENDKKGQEIQSTYKVENQAPKP